MPLKFEHSHTRIHKRQKRRNEVNIKYIKGNNIDFTLVMTCLPTSKAEQERCRESLKSKCEGTYEVLCKTLNRCLPFKPTQDEKAKFVFDNVSKLSRFPHLMQLATSEEPFLPADSPLGISS